MADISSINLNGNPYNIKDNNAVTKNDVIDIAHGGTSATTAANARTKLNVLNKSGDTFNGDFTLPIGNKIKTGKSDLSFITSQASNNSSNPTVLIQAGGNLLLSGGEFASNALSTDLDSSSTGGENLYLGSDGNVYLYSNGNTVANAKRWIFKNTGETQLPSALSTAYGGTGNANGTVAKLTTARNIQIDLAKTTSVSFNGSADITPGVTGILGTANGGTGNANGTVDKLTTARSIRVNLASTYSSTTNHVDFDGSKAIAIPVGGVLGTDHGGTGGTDSGWVNISSSLNTSSVTLASGGYFMYRKIGRFILLWGEKLNPATTNSTQLIKLATLSSALIPDHKVNSTIEFSRGYASFLMIGADGNIEFYKPPELSTLTVNSTYMYFSVMYMLPKQ